MSVGENIKRIRKEKNMTLQQIADIMCCSPQLVSQYETGKRMPKLETIKKIATALNTDLGNLLKVNEDGNSVYDFTSFNFDEIKAALSDIVPGVKEVIESENNDRKAKLLSNYEQLNEIGQNKAIEQVELLTKIPEYQKEPDKAATYINAAHADNYADAPEELKQLEESIMDDEDF